MRPPGNCAARPIDNRNGRRRGSPQAPQARRRRPCPGRGRAPVRPGWCRAGPRPRRPRLPAGLKSCVAGGLLGVSAAVDPSRESPRYRAPAGPPSSPSRRACGRPRGAQP